MLVQRSDAIPPTRLSRTSATSPSHGATNSRVSQQESSLRGPRLVAFNVSSWMKETPNGDLSDLVKLLPLVQPDERSRIQRFYFEIDSRRALVGRLVLRWLVMHGLNMDWDSIKLIRSPANRPILDASFPQTTFDFNMSHHGEWVVGASHPNRSIGVDIMDLARPRGDSVPSFFSLMEGQFTAHEWTQIRIGRNGLGDADEAGQLYRFYQFWCLKESFIKATGDGLSFGLQRLCFTLPKTMTSPSREAAISVKTTVTPPVPPMVGSEGDRTMTSPSQEAVVSVKTTVSTADTPSVPPTVGNEGNDVITLAIDGELAKGWDFFLDDLDENHVYAVAYGPISDHKDVKPAKSILRALASKLSPRGGISRKGVGVTTRMITRSSSQREAETATMHVTEASGKGEVQTGDSASVSSASSCLGGDESTSHAVAKGDSELPAPVLLTMPDLLGRAKKLMSEDHTLSEDDALRGVAQSL